ncbi:surface adhesion protein Lsa23 [Leptospira santarosai]|uniref:surface adhesion protein Lsa23 n=1 Tax=Leptospira santarosai TaxID=28183 RepID=UPI00095A0F8C|nr:hypothetical protein [Leptospira santarosai]OLY63713.1 hypothetical protein BWD11_12755 [Leptospira santarosai serovar Grippotyphosa]ONF79085.1 hypothetical protein BWD12_10225 [Leptospira santarosai serovar Bananal]
MNSVNISANFPPPFETSSIFSGLTGNRPIVKNESMFVSRLSRFGLSVFFLVGCSYSVSQNLILLYLKDQAARTCPSSGTGSYTKNELPIFSTNLECSRKELPLFIQPIRDIEDGNGLETIYCNRRETPSGKRIELNLVFQDERHPSVWKDKIYRFYRGFKYGRYKDIETIRLQFSKTEELSTIHLKNVYSGKQKFAEDPVYHFDSVLKPEQLMKENQKNILFINTWNHMLSEKDFNPELSKKKLDSVELRTGTREELDLFYSKR